MGLAVCGGIAAGSAQAASVDDPDVRLDIQNRGAARLLLALNVDASLARLKQDPAGLQRDALQMEQSLLKTLGDAIVPGTLWRNNLGQISVVVRGQGMDKLHADKAVRAILADHGAPLRAGYPIDPEVGAIIDQQLQNGGAIRVRAVLHGDNRASENATSRSKRFREFIGTAPRGGVVAQEAAAATAPGGLAAGQTLTINRDGWWWLEGNPDVQSLELVDSALLPARAVVGEGVAAALAESDGVSVTVSLKVPGPGLHRSGRLSREEREAQIARNKGAVAAFVARLRQARPDARVQTHDDFPFVSLHLDRKTLAGIEAGQYPEIARVTKNFELQPMLNTSTVAMRLPPVWNLGYTGNGQVIAILDSGVAKNHRMLAGKVIYEACFGPGDYPGVQNLCPSPDTYGNNIGGVNAGLPACPAGCDFSDHGTMVAGIAAGYRQFWAGDEMSGVANGAQLAAFQINALKGPGQLVVPSPAIYAALVHIHQAAQAGTRNLVVNASVGGLNAASACDALFLPFAEVIGSLRSMDVPVIAATGNENQTSRVGFPACLSATIKGTSVTDAGGRAAYANAWNPAVVGGGELFAAPGEEIYSARNNGGLSASNGTSFAAPHVAGFYALLKAAVPGISVSSASAWIMANAIQPAHGFGYDVKRIVAPY